MEISNPKNGDIKSKPQQFITSKKSLNQFRNEIGRAYNTKHGTNQNDSLSSFVIYLQVTAHKKSSHLIVCHEENTKI